jgi:hypothetical protein
MIAVTDMELPVSEAHASSTSEGLSPANLLLKIDADLDKFWSSRKQRSDPDPSFVLEFDRCHLDTLHLKPRRINGAAVRFPEVIEIEYKIGDGAWAPLGTIRVPVPNDWLVTESIKIRLTSPGKTIEADALRITAKVLPPDVTSAYCFQLARAGISRVWFDETVTALYASRYRGSLFFLGDEEQDRHVLPATDYADMYNKFASIVRAASPFAVPTPGGLRPDYMTEPPFFTFDYVNTFYQSCN